ELVHNRRRVEAPLASNLRRGQEQIAGPDLFNEVGPSAIEQLCSRLRINPPVIEWPVCDADDPTAIRAAESDQRLPSFCWRIAGSFESDSRNSLGDFFQIEFR